MQGSSGPAQGIIPTIARPTPASVIPPPNPNAQEGDEPEPGLRVSASEMARLKLLGRKNLPTGGREIHLDSTPTPLAPNLRTNFSGLGQNGWSPYDAAIAVGPNDIVVMTNEQWIVYDRTGSVVRAVTGFGAWWGTPAGGPFDPKCFYDAVSGRFVMIAVSKNGTTGKAFTHISVSQTGDPIGSWNNYQLDSTLNGNTQTSNWSDFPGLGCDDNAIYITSDQYNFSNAFQYAKIRVLSKAQLYSGSAATFTDFTGFTNSDGSLVFAPQPARTLSSTSSEYFLNTNPYGRSSVTLWRISGAPASPSLVRQKTFTIGAFSDPPDALQPGTTTLVVTNDARMYDFVWRGGIIHAAFGESFSGLAAVRYLRLNTTNNSVVKDVTYTQPGVYYYYPTVADDSAGNMYMVFTRSSATEYPSVYQTGMQPADSAIQSSALVKAGLGTNTSGRWGDYNAIANDPADSLAVVSYAGWANTSNRWGTWITGASFAAGGTPLPTLTAINPTQGFLGTTVSVTLAGTNFVGGMSVNISGTLVTVSNVVVSSSTQATADFTVAFGAAAGSRSVTVTTAGGTSSPATFTVVGVPVISSISPNNVSPGSITSVTLSGSQFYGGSVNVSGSGVTPSNVQIKNFGTTITFTATAAATAAGGPRNVTVVNTSGTSNAVALTVNGGTSPPTLTLVTPSNGDPGTSVSATLTGTNFTMSSTVAVSGSGVTVSNVNVLSSTSITATFNIASSAAGGARNVSVTTANGTSGTVAFTVNAMGPTITTTSLPNGEVAVAYNASLAATGGTAPYVWSVTSGALPGGIILNSVTRALSGTPTTSGTFNFTITATDALAHSGSQPLSIAVLPAVTISTSSLNSGQVGITYSATPAAANGQTPYAWSVTSGNLPAGLNLNGTTGAISGSPTTAGTFSFTASVTDGLSGSTSATLSITVRPPVDAATASLPNGTPGVAYSASVIATGGTTPYTWSIVTGALPTGLILNSSTGAITGTPTATGTFGFTVQVTDALGQTDQTALSIGIYIVPTLTSITPNRGYIGTTSTVTLAGTAFTTGMSVLVSGTLVTVSNVNVNSSTQATADVSVALTALLGDRNVSVATPGGTSGSVTLKIVGLPVISTISPTSGTPGAAVTVTMTGSQFYGGSVNISSTDVTVSNVQITNFGAKITFTATIASNAVGGPRNVTVVNGAGTSNAVVFTVNGSPPPTITTTSLATGETGVSFNATLAATGGSPPYTWGISTGVLPGGLSLATATGAITGLPNASGTFNFTVTVTDSLSHISSKALSIVIVPLVSVATSTLPRGQVGIAYSTTLPASNGQAPFAWSISLGALPAGLSLNTSTGAISGTPTTAVTSNFTVTVTDALSGSASKALSTSVNPAVSVAITALPSGTVGWTYSTSLSASGGTTPYSWAIVSGTLPSGLSLNSATGTISGIPALAGSFSFTAQVTDGVGQTAAAALNISMSLPPPPALTSMSPTQGAQGSTTPVTLIGTNFAVPATLSFSSAGVTASNVVVVDAQTITANLVIASGATIGNYSVSITTPGGTTGAVTFLVAGAPSISTISPISGNRGTTVTVTLTGSRFYGCTPAITGSGVTISNVTITNFGAKMTMKLTIASGAPVGPRDITVFNAAGTSNPAIFTVN